MAVQMHIDRDEAVHIALSTLVIALVFTFYANGLKLEPSTFIFSMAKYTIAVGSGFILHELAHKYYGIKYGAKARFQSWPLGLAGALALVIIPQIIGWGAFLFIAPGAVYIYAMRHISPKENGIISLAGPATNWLVAFAFLALALVFSSNPIIIDVAASGYFVNVQLAMFNLLPIFPLDGSKVMSWDWKIWGAAFVFSIFLLGLPAAL